MSLTVAELIAQLEAIEDKSLPVGHEYDAGYGWTDTGRVRLDHKDFSDGQGTRLMVMLEEDS